MSTEQTIVAEIRKNKREVIRVVLEQFEGRPIVSMRVWFEAGDGALRPSKSGLSCRATLLPEIAKAILAAERQAGAFLAARSAEAD